MFKLPFIAKQTNLQPWPITANLDLREYCANTGPRTVEVNISLIFGK